MPHDPLTSNLTIIGAGIPAFAEAVAILHAEDRLWSSVCDKKGDWMISTGDDGLTPELFGKLKTLSLRVIQAGEIATMVEDHPEYAGLWASRVLWHREENEL